MPGCSAHHERWAIARASSAGSANVVPDALGEPSRLERQPPSRVARVDVVDGVADGLQVGEVLVVDAEADGALAELLLERLDELDQGQRVGVEVVDERLTLADRRRLDLEDVGEPVADDLEDLVAPERALFDVGLGRHRSVHATAGRCDCAARGARSTMPPSTISWATSDAR